MIADGDGRKREARSVRYFHVHIFGPSSVVKVTGDEQIGEESDGASDDDEPQEPANRNGSGKFTLLQMNFLLNTYKMAILALEVFLHDKQKSASKCYIK